MIVEEVEYRKAFMCHKRWAKHWLTHSAHRAHSSTLGMMEPADKSLKLIELIDTKDKSYKEKFELLDRFYNEQDRIEKSSKFMGSGYYLGVFLLRDDKLGIYEKGNKKYKRYSYGI